jgi:3-oxoacyl-ACP reductase-like protein
MGSAFLRRSWLTCASPPSAPSSPSARPGSVLSVSRLTGTCVARCLPAPSNLRLPPPRACAQKHSQAALAPHPPSPSARPILALRTCDTRAAGGSGLLLDSLLPSGVPMAAIRALVLAGAVVALSTAPSSYGLPTFVPLSSEQSKLLARMLQWALVACLVRDINSTLNAWAENRWMFTTDKSSWQWPKELAVVTGGSNGIGAAVVKQLTSHGVKVAVLDIQPLSEALQKGARHAFVLTHAQARSRR